jgi:tetratricopeptide (TPR) repeat protein
LFNLGHVFKNVPQLRDLDESAKYYTEAYKSYPEHDSLARAQCLGQLGALSLARLEEGVASNLPERQMLRYLNDSVHYYEDALSMIPSDAIIDLARVHNQLGVVLRFSKTEHLRAVDHFKKAIAFFDMARERLESAIARVNVAQMLAILSRKEEAQEFVKDAIAIFESVNYSGPYLQHARKLIGKGGRIA